MLGGLNEKIVADQQLGGTFVGRMQLTDTIPAGASENGRSQSSVSITQGTV